jgi:hypothetical protein
MVSMFRHGLYESTLARLLAREWACYNRASQRRGLRCAKAHTDRFGAGALPCT